MKKAFWVGMAAFVGICAVAPLASADPPKKGQDVEYKFTDDKLLGDTMGVTGVRIPVRKVGIRDRLLRPRLHFVQEMLKSVENM